MLRFLTAGESHGQALVVILEGLPAGIRVTEKQIQDELARRRLGFGRGPRMRFEADDITEEPWARPSPLRFETQNGQNGLKRCLLILVLLRRCCRLLDRGMQI